MVIVILGVAFLVGASVLLGVAYMMGAPMVVTSVVVVAMGVFGMVLGFFTAAHAAYMSRQKRQYNIELPDEPRKILSNNLIMAQFGGMLVGMTMAITERVAFRVLKEACPVSIPEEFEESAKEKAQQIIQEEADTFIEELQRNVQGRDGGF